jgi:hypothetical protein
MVSTCFLVEVGTGSNRFTGKELPKNRFYGLRERVNRGKSGPDSVVTSANYLSG